jgi:hypothetical protein
MFISWLLIYLLIYLFKRTSHNYANQSLKDLHRYSKQQSRLSQQQQQEQGDDPATHD